MTAPMRTWTDRIVDGDVPLAARDYGGDGPDVLLMHGAGRTVVDFGPIAARLPGYRLVAFDLRNHGLSGDGDWNWDTAVSDIQTVIDGIGLHRPAIVGHSLGGMIGGLWADEHPECPAVVNLDGHGQGKPEQYDGLPVDLVVQRMTEMRTLQQSMIPPPIPEEHAGALTAAMLEQARQHGIDVAVMEEGIERAVRTKDGLVTMRPTGPYLEQLMASLDTIDLMSVWAGTKCPLLIVNAIAPQSELPAGAPEWLGELMSAYRAGLSRTLGELADAHPLVTVATFDGDHSLLLNQPDATGALVRSFLDQHVRR